MGAVRAWVAFALLLPVLHAASAGSLELTGHVASNTQVMTLHDVDTVNPQIQGHRHMAAAGDGAAQILGSASYGTLGALSGAEVQLGPFATWSATLQASWTDVFRIIPRNPALMFTAGTLTFLGGATGSGGVVEAVPTDQWGAFSTWGAAVTMLTPVGTALASAGGTWSGSSFTGFSYVGDLLPAPIMATVDFIFGVDMLLSGALQTGAQVDMLSSQWGWIEAHAALQGSLHWGGFADVRDSAGPLLTARDYEVISESGTDWSLPAAPPIPEPATRWLMAVGVLWGAWRARKSHATGRRLAGRVR